MAGDALAGWLAAAIAFGAVPAGALVLLMMMRLIPGAWGEQLRLTGEAAALLVPVAALLFLPVLLGLTMLYPWMHQAPDTGFQRFWLAPLPFVAASLLWFAAQFDLARRMRARRRSLATAALGVMAMPVLAFIVATLWLMSLDPAFASSAIGLQFLLILVTIAFAALVLARLTAGRMPLRPGVLGGLLLTLSLLGTYFQFLPFFITWSGNLASDAGWYALRASSGWQAAAAIFGLLGGWPAAAMLFAGVRRSRKWLLVASASMLAGKLLEIAWFILPGHGALGTGAYCVGLILVGVAATFGLGIALGRRIAARMPMGAPR